MLRLSKLRPGWEVGFSLGENASLRVEPCPREGARGVRQGGRGVGGGTFSCNGVGGAVDVDAAVAARQWKILTPSSARRVHGCGVVV